MNFADMLKEMENIQESKGMIEDLIILHSFTLERKFKNILELGVLHGNSTRAFAFASSALPDCHLTSVDIEEGCCKETFLQLEKLGLEKYVTFIVSDSIQFLKSQPNHIYDCIFIDTNHVYEQTMSELTEALKKIKKDGIIFIHDLYMKEVKKAVDSVRQKIEFNLKLFNTPAGLGMVELVNR